MQIGYNHPKQYHQEDGIIMLTSPCPHLTNSLLIIINTLKGAKFYNNGTPKRRGVNSDDLINTPLT